MFQTFQDLYTKAQSKTHDSDSTTLAVFKDDINIAIGLAYSVLNAEHFYKDETDLTVDGQQSYPRPYNESKIVSMKIAVNSRDYVVKEFTGSENDWIALNIDSTAESEIPTYFFIKRNTYEIYPTPSADDNTITIRVKRIAKELTEADYVTGNVTTLANAGTAVTGSGTTWDATFAGRFFKIDADGYWYEISTRSSNTAIVLAREYGGTAISAGSASYTIGEGSLLPFNYQHLPIYYTLWQYYSDKDQDKKAFEYKSYWEQGLADLKSFGSSDTTSGVLEEDIKITDPNQYPLNLQSA